MQDRIAYKGYTFDDVLLEPGFSQLLPSDVHLDSKVTRNISVSTPIISSPMDTVTESEMAISMAQLGGIGIIHKNMPAEQQAMEVDRVKRSEHGVIVDPVTLPPETSVGEASRIMDERNIGGVPITVDGRLVGILTRRDLRFRAPQLRVAQGRARRSRADHPARGPRRLDRRRPPRLGTHSRRPFALLRSDRAPRGRTRVRQEGLRLSPAVDCLSPAAG